MHDFYSAMTLCFISSWFNKLQWMFMQWPSGWWWSSRWGVWTTETLWLLQWQWSVLCDHNCCDHFVYSRCVSYRAGLCDSLLVLVWQLVGDCVTACECLCDSLWVLVWQRICILFIRKKCRLSEDFIRCQAFSFHSCHKVVVAVYIC